MKKSELKEIIKRELLKEGFEGFNGVISLGATNKMTSLNEKNEDLFSGTQEYDEEDVAVALQDALDKIEDKLGFSVADDGRMIQDIFNKLITQSSRELDI